ncbi:GDSL esterase/lipase [Prunus yedoensis var. nudiflora]|uniref:GDSL esterase/lipase n=1 Tax=Prunus yedoensis var. nudiflora TaxID=2094558 RepID=A0A314Y1K7_PRUYE|nr:GDSL esterase/lipase [Prunus yedoensis var. nudiflora]
MLWWVLSTIYLLQEQWHKQKLGVVYRSVKVCVLDAYHPTEAANMIIAKRLLDGNESVSYPINIRELYNYNS